MDRACLLPDFFLCLFHSSSFYIIIRMLFSMYVLLYNLKPFLYVLPFLKLCLFPSEFCMKRCLIMTHNISFQAFPSCIIYYFRFILVRNMTCCLVAFSRRIKGEFWMLMLMEGFLCLYRLLHPYFILNEVFFSHLYFISYLMPVNSVSDLPCLLVCLFLI